MTAEDVSAVMGQRNTADQLRSQSLAQIYDLEQKDRQLAQQATMAAEANEQGLIIAAMRKMKTPEELANLISDTERKVKAGNLDQVKANEILKLADEKLNKLQAETGRIGSETLLNKQRATELEHKNKNATDNVKLTIDGESFSLPQTVASEHKIEMMKIDGSVKKENAKAAVTKYKISSSRMHEVLNRYAKTTLDLTDPSSILLSGSAGYSEMVRQAKNTLKNEKGVNILDKKGNPVLDPKGQTARDDLRTYSRDFYTVVAPDGLAPESVFSSKIMEIPVDKVINMRDGNGVLLKVKRTGTGMVKILEIEGVKYAD